jgi:hypothetical protein
MVLFLPSPDASAATTARVYFDTEELTPPHKPLSDEMATVRLFSTSVSEKEERVRE